MVLLVTPKGWTGPAVVDGVRVEGTWRAHQVPLAATRENDEHRAQLEEWMRSYRPEELFEDDGRLVASLRELAPEGSRRMSANPHANGGLLRRPLVLGDFRDHAVEVAAPGGSVHEATRVLGQYLVDVVRNKGYRVTEVSEQDLWEIVRLRQQLEAPPMREIARILQPETAAELRGKAQAIVDAAAAADLAAYLAADMAFHLRLLELHGNRRLVAMVQELRQQTRMVGLADMIGTAELTRSAAEHHSLVDLLEARDGRGAEALLTAHIGHVLGWWNGRAEEYPSEHPAAR
jgi:DNA-binding GntR family transcriptional regulator